MNNFLKEFNPSPSENPEVYAAIYSRKSSDNANNSIESQESIGMEVLHEKNLLLYDKYSDIISATEKPLTARKDFMRMYRDAEKGLFKNIIVFKRDRLARDFTDWLKIKDFFTKHGIKIIYSDGTEFVPSNKNCIDNFIDNIIFGVAAFEPDQLKERCGNGIKKKHERGEYYSSKKAYGYERSQNTKEKSNIEEILNKNNTLEKEYPLLIDYVRKNNCSFYYPNDEEASIVREIFHMYINLKENETVEKHILPIINEKRKSIEKNKYERFVSQRINNIIQNPLYCGMGLKKGNTNLKFKNFFIKINDSNEYALNQNLFVELNNAVPIIDEALWEKAALKRIKNYKSKSSERKPNFFKDLLYCGKCKDKNGDMKKINLFGTNYYRCDTTSCFSMREDDLQNLLISKIIKDISSNELSESINRYSKKINTEIYCLNQSLQQKLKIKNERLFEYIEEPTNQKKTADLKKIVTDIHHIRKKISERNSILADLNYAKSQLNKLKLKKNIPTKAFIDELKKDIEQSNMLLKSFIEKVVLVKNPKSYEIQYKSKHSSLC